MMDIIDTANDLAELQLAQALAEQKQRAQTGAFQIRKNGEVICRDCHDPIEPQRLVYLPDAVRCISCQQIEEKRRAR